ncbi:TPA: helix-turn-helix domain-containing protein, partial [Listeria monocytogenes]
IEKNPEKKWTDKDFDGLSISANTARRQFQKQFGMTFIEYARSRRLGLAFKHIRNGDSIINAQIDSGYESGNGFR